MPKPYINLQPSEAAIVQAAATIYAGYLSSGRVKHGEEHEQEWLKRSIRDAIRIARTTDDSIQADDEMS